MATTRQKQLESAVAAVQGRYGPRSLRRASDVALRALPPHISTGFPTLDALTGCAGIPLDANTLLSGQMTSGKLTVAYKTLACAQTASGKASAGSPLGAVALLDLTRSANPDYLARCGVDIEHVLLVRPDSAKRAVDLLLDLVRSRGVRAVLVDSLVEIAAERDGLRHLAASLGKLSRLFDGSGCAVLWIDEPEPVWMRLVRWDRAAPLRPYAALHLMFQQESWAQRRKGLAGYQAHVQLAASRWAKAGESARVGIVFNGTVRAAPTW